MEQTKASIPKSYNRSYTNLLVTVNATIETQPTWLTSGFTPFVVKAVSYNGGNILKKLVIMVLSLVSCFTLSGCSLFGGSGNSADQTTDSSTLQAEKEDISNSNYSLKVRKDMNLVSGQIIFSDHKMEWTRTYTGTEKDTASTSQEKTVLNDIKIKTEVDTYTISGKEDGKEVSVTFKKIGNYRIEDQDGNIYSL